MNRLKRWLLALVIACVVLAVGYAVLNFVFLDFVVDWSWFSALGYSGYFWLRLIYRYLVFLVALIVFFFIFFLNFWIAARYLGSKSSASGEETPGRHRQLLKMFRTASLKVYTPLSLILSIPLALSLFDKWNLTLLHLFAPAAGIQDPAFGRDVSYYLFSLPLYNLIQTDFLLVFTVVFLATVVLYWLEKRTLAKADQHLPWGAKLHLSLLILIVAGIQVWGFLLQRYTLLYSKTHQPLFYGPGFTEMQVILPLLWGSIAVLAALVLAVLIFSHTRKGLIWCIVFAVLFAGVQAVRHFEFLPNLVQEYVVKPNEISKERPYIENSIQGTLAAFDLSEVKTREYPVERLPWTVVTPQVEESIRNVPVWDRELLGAVYEQLQGIRPYYHFQGIDVDRYSVRNLFQQVYLSAREINLEKLPGSSKSWINLHLQYTHGHGVVMTPAAQGGDDVLTWFIQDIPPKSDYGLTVKQPGIYYGLGEQPYAIAPNDVGEMDYPQGEKTVTTNYDGTGGVPISSLFRKAIFAAYFKDKKLFLTTKVNNKSRILFRRQIVERIKTITPFLRLDSDPYVVTTDEGLFWIQDAYTASDHFPYAAPHKTGVNYIRNGAKVVVDAYNGTVTYYLSDKTDPIIRAYARMYPGLLKDLDEMPEGLKSHIRYPKDLFKMQMDMYIKYHQTDPEIFYREEDIWDYAKVRGKDGQVDMDPYYITLSLIERDRPEFLLLCPMSPKGRDNLRSLVLVGCDKEHYGEFFTYSFPKGIQVYGPSQISALIDQDTRIAEQFTLWDQVGSEVKRGKMIIMPMGNVIFYIQPVYLSAASLLNIPELKRLIVSQGDVVVMDKSLDKAFERIGQRIRRYRQEQAEPSEMGQADPPSTQTDPAEPEQSPQEAGHAVHSEET